MMANNKIKIINFDTKSSAAERRQVPMFPNTMRCGLFGPSGCGKTNVLLTILLHKQPIKHIYLCSRTSFQDKYQILRNLTDSAKVHYHELQIDKLPLPENIKPDSIVIFDDVLTDDQTKIANFFIRGRHRNISCFYLAQSYTKIPKKSCIRENFNYIILFRQDSVNLRQIYNEHITGIPFDKFKKLCSKCWSQKYGFLTYDEDFNIFRKNLEYQLK